MSDFFNNFNDLISAHLPEIIAIVTSGTFVLLVMRFLLNLILIKVKGKTLKTANSEIVGKYEALEKKVESVVSNLENVFLDYMEKYSNMTKEQFASLMEQYQKTKKEYLKAVISAETETKELIKKAEEIQKQVVNQIQQDVNKEIEDNTKTDTPEEIEEIEEIIEQVSEVPKINLDDESVSKESEEDGYIVVKKFYGE